jgi:hypothetical protein
MKSLKLALAPAVLSIAIGLASPAAADPISMDNPTTMNGVEVVCTGIGSSQQDPRWPSYPVRVEFSNGGAQYLAGAQQRWQAGGGV